MQTEMHVAVSPGVQRLGLAVLAIETAGRPAETVALLNIDHSAASRLVFLLDSPTEPFRRA